MRPEDKLLINALTDPLTKWVESEDRQLLVRESWNFTVAELRRLAAATVPNYYRYGPNPVETLDAIGLLDYNVATAAFEAAARANIPDGPALAARLEALHQALARAAIACGHSGYVRPFFDVEDLCPAASGQLTLPGIESCMSCGVALPTGWHSHCLVCETAYRQAMMEDGRPEF
jgi:hypothetical protein